VRNQRTMKIVQFGATRQSNNATIQE